MLVTSPTRPMYCYRLNAVGGRDVRLLGSKRCQLRDIHVDLEASAQDRYQLPHWSDYANFIRLGLHVFILISVSLVVFFTVKLSYSYAQEKVAFRTLEEQQVRATGSLSYEGQRAPGEPIAKAVKSRRYAEGWYKCIGEGAITVLLWTML